MILFENIYKCYVTRKKYWKENHQNVSSSFLLVLVLETFNFFLRTFDTFLILSNVKYSLNKQEKIIIFLKILFLKDGSWYLKGEKLLEMKPWDYKMFIKVVAPKYALLM